MKMPEEMIPAGSQLPETTENQTPNTGQPPLDPKNYRKAVRRLGQIYNPRFPQRFSVATLQAKEEVGRQFSRKMASRVMIADNLDVKDRLDNAIRLGEDMISNADLNPEIRIKGIGILAGAAKVSGELAEQIIRFAEIAEEKAKNVNGDRPRNRPPALAMEVKTGEGESQVTTRVVASNGQESE